MNTLESRASDLSKALLNLSYRTLAQYEAVSNALRRLFTTDRKLLVAGCGGSMADAMHFAGELTGYFSDRSAIGIPAIALCDPSVMSAIGNDKNFDDIFARQISALGRIGDVALLISTSGESRPIINAARECRIKKMLPIGLIGRLNSELEQLCSYQIVLDMPNTPTAQEIMKVVLHSLAQDLEYIRSPE